VLRTPTTLRRRGVTLPRGRHPVNGTTAARQFDEQCQGVAASERARANQKLCY